MRKSVKDILTMMQSENPRERAMALTFIGKQREYTVVQSSMMALQDPDGDVRAMAAWALDRLGVAATVAVPVLLEALYDPVFGVRSNAGWALVHLTRRTMPQLVVPEVVDILRFSDNDHARQMAYLVLHHIGGEVAREAIMRYWRD